LKGKLLRDFQFTPKRIASGMIRGDTRLGSLFVVLLVFIPAPQSADLLPEINNPDK
jgi:hypothetical protein